jgi:hypothetical protein
MSFYAPGGRPITSTDAPATDPSTTAILAELDSTSFGSTRGGRHYAVNVYLGGSTACTFIVEHATSTNIASSAASESHLFWSGGPTAQYVKRFVLNGSDRIRVRQPTAVAGTFHAKLQAEEIV